MLQRLTNGKTINIKRNACQNNNPPLTRSLSLPARRSTTRNTLIPKPCEAIVVMQRAVSFVRCIYAPPILPMHRGVPKNCQVNLQRHCRRQSIKNCLQFARHFGDSGYHFYRLISSMSTSHIFIIFFCMLGKFAGQFHQVNKFFSVTFFIKACGSLRHHQYIRIRRRAFERRVAE